MKKIPGFQILGLAGCLAALALLTGCFETTQDFTLNPDGSGKVVHESKFQNMVMNGAKGSADEQTKAAIADVLKNAKGVVAWRDVSAKVLDDGRIDFKGTAYFKNLSELEIPNQTMMDFDWTPSAGGSGALTLRIKKNASNNATVAPVDPAKLSPEERANKVKEDRMKYMQAKPMMTAFMATMKQSVVFHLPGKPGETSSFTRDPSGALLLQMDGAKMLAVMDKLVGDDAWMAKNSDALNGQGSSEANADMTALMFGGKGPVRAAVTGPAGAAFDFDAEVAAAKKDFVPPQS
jgi:hypothetical protein